MKKPNTQPDTAASERGAKPNLNLAAARLAAAFGLKLGSRENLEPTSERLAFRWSCRDSTSGQDWTMELVCLPVLFGQDGWMGSVHIFRYGVRNLIDKNFVSYGHRLSGRKACKLTRERFCDWATTLEPDSWVTTNRVAIEPASVVVV